MLMILEIWGSYAYKPYDYKKKSVYKKIWSMDQLETELED